MKYRHGQDGGTLSLVVSLTFVMVLLGAACYFLTLILGGGKELQNAIDAGNLTVARESGVRPFVSLNPGINPFESRLLAHVDPRYRADNGVDLNYFNNSVGQALIVSLNAQADGNPLGITNANSLITAIEIGNDSLGGRLRAAVSSNALSNPLITSFSPVAQGNTVRMLGARSTVDQDNNEFEVSYVDQRPGDDGATNLLLERISLPFVSFSGAGTRVSLPDNATVQVNGRTFLRGYQSIQVNAPGLRPLVGLAINPLRQPQLASLSIFRRDQSTRFLPADYRLPPNSFKSGAQSLAVKPNSNVRLVSCAKASSLQTLLNPEIARGYIRVSNDGSLFTVPPPQPGGFLNCNGVNIAVNNVAAGPLQTGISIDYNPASVGDSQCRANPCFTGWFALTPSREIEAWRQHDVSPVNVPGMGLRDHIEAMTIRYGSIENEPGTPSFAGIRKPPDGRIVVSKLDAHAIPYANHPWNRNRNMGAGRNASEADVIFDTNFTTKPNSMGFDLWRNRVLDDGIFGPSNWSYGTPTTIPNVTAAEFIKNEVIRAYGDGPQPNENRCDDILIPGKASGLRLFPKFRDARWPDPAGGENTPHKVNPPNGYSDLARPCVVTLRGTIPELFKQVCDPARPPGQPNSGEGRSGQGRDAERQVRNFIANRMQEIKFDVTDAEIEEITKKEIDITAGGVPVYIYMDGNRRFHLDAGPPPGLADVPAFSTNNVDGRVFTWARGPYNLYSSFVNSDYETDIHQILYFTYNGAAPGGLPDNPNPGFAGGSDYAQFITESGASLRLGQINFRQEAAASLNLCNRN